MKYTLRIKKNRDFKYILKKGKFFCGNYINVYCIKNNNIGEKNMLGICVSKKNGNAVSRNKLKRWAREAYKLNENILKKKNSIVILYKKNTQVINTNFNLIFKDLSNALEGLNIYENN